MILCVLVYEVVTSLTCCLFLANVHNMSHLFSGDLPARLRRALPGHQRPGRLPVPFPGLDLPPEDHASPGAAGHRGASHGAGRQ